MQNLTQYLKAENLTQAQFAERIEVRQSTVSKLCTGEKRPSWDLAARIARATDGKVPVSVWADVAQAEGGGA